MAAELQSKYALSVFFILGIQQDQKDSSQQIVTPVQGGLTLPDRDYYLTDDERSQKLREQYVDACDEDVCAAGRHAGEGGGRGEERDVGSRRRWRRAR